MHIWTRGYVHLLIGGMSLVVACTPSNAGSGCLSQISARCAVSSRVTAGLPEGAPTADRSLPEGSLRLDRFYTLRGNCAAQARSFAMEHILLADGRILKVEDGGALSNRSEPLSSIGPSVLSPSQAPRLRGAQLVYAARLGPTQIRPPSGSAYVGVWSNGSRSIIAGFRIAADGQASTPEPLLESDLPVIGVGYFPSPDSRSGQLGVVQRVSANTVRLLNYQWHHPSL